MLVGKDAAIGRAPARDVDRRNRLDVVDGCAADRDHRSAGLPSTSTGCTASIFAPRREAISSPALSNPRSASRFLIVGKIIFSVASASSIVIHVVSTASSFATVASTSRDTFVRKKYVSNRFGTPWGVIQCDVQTSCSKSIGDRSEERRVGK